MDLNKYKYAICIKLFEEQSQVTNLSFLQTSLKQCRSDL